jgi:hypothetical protein
MPETPDLTGQPFGKLTVQSLLPNRDRHGNRQWLCQCDCNRGGPCIVTTDRLVKGITRSCGCLPHATPADLTGQPFGKLTARELLAEKTVHGHRQWRCDCECGGSCVVTTNRLLQGSTRSCGCLRDRPPHDLARQVFGRLTAIELLPAKNRRGEYQWRCKCACGRSCTVAENRLLTGHNSSCGKCVGPLSSKRVRAEQRAKQRVVIDGTAYYAPRLTARLLRIDKSTLYGSKSRTGYKDSCPWLGGEGLPTLPLEGAFGRETNYFHGPTVDQARAAQAATLPVPTAAGLVSIAAARKKLGISDRTLYRRLKLAHVRVEKRRSKDRQGHPRWRAYVPQSFIEANGRNLEDNATVDRDGTNATEQPAADLLSDRQRDILQTLLRQCAFDIDHRMTTDEIVERVAGRGRGSAASFKRPIADLRRSGLVLTKDGRDGGCWLTVPGRELIQGRSL